jgi:hypothetical protein
LFRIVVGEINWQMDSILFLMWHLAILICTDAAIQIFRTSAPEVSYLTSMCQCA